MKQREKILAAVLIVGAFVMWGFPLLKGLIFGGIEDRQIKLTSLLRAEETIDDNELQLLAARKNLSKWEHRSLPPDAEEAELLYQEWLTDLAQIAGLTSVHVIPQPPAPRTSDKYATVRIDIKAEATFEQLTAFLQDFRRVDLMHRISALKIEGAKNPGGPLKIEATAEGLCLKDASSRMDLLPRTKLVDSLPRSFKSFKVLSPEDFPKESGFDIRIDKELLKVAKLAGNEWTVERHVDGTSAGRHAPKSDVELFPLNSDRADFDWKAQQKALKMHPFVRPIPPRPPGGDPDDPARQTRLMASIDVGDERAAWLENTKTQARTRLRKGSSVDVGDIHGVVVSVEPTLVQIQRGEGEVWELKFGKDLRSMTRVDESGDDSSPDSFMDSSGPPSRENRGSGGRQRSRARRSPNASTDNPAENR